MKSNHNKIKLFLVDDDAVFLKLSEIEFLENADFSIETYATGELCVAQLANKPDVIILDYHLDGIVRGAMNGIQTLDKIKAFGGDTPVIVLSSQDKIEDGDGCFSRTPRAGWNHPAGCPARTERPRIAGNAEGVCPAKRSLQRGGCR